MTSWLLLLGFVLVASTAGARALQAADWPSRAPRLAILAWQSLSASVVMAVTLGSLILILAHPHFSGGVTSFAHLRAQALAGIQGRLQGPQPRLLAGCCSPEQPVVSPCLRCRWHGTNGANVTASPA